MSGLTDAEREARMQRVSDAAVGLAESIWTEDEPTLAEYELAEAIVRSDWLAAREQAAAAKAWQEGFESDFEGDGWPPNPYLRAAVDAAPSQPEGDGVLVRPDQEVVVRHRAAGRGQWLTVRGLFVGLDPDAAPSQPEGHASDYGTPVHHPGSRADCKVCPPGAAPSQPEGER